MYLLTGSVFVGGYFLGYNQGHDESRPKPCPVVERDALNYSDGLSDGVRVRQAWELAP